MKDALLGRLDGCGQQKEILWKRVFANADEKGRVAGKMSTPEQKYIIAPE
jgi:hypothetical protein